MRNEKKTTAPKDTRFSADVGSELSLSARDERDLASLINPGIHPQYNTASGWWSVHLHVTTMKGRPTFTGKGRTFIRALSGALARWRRNEPSHRGAK